MTDQPQLPPIGERERLILQVLSQHPDGCLLEKLALLSGYKLRGIRTTRGFKTAVARLSRAGLIAQSQLFAHITDAGRQYGPFETLPEGQALTEYWLTHPAFTMNEISIMRALIAYPDGVYIGSIAEVIDTKFVSRVIDGLTALRIAQLAIGANSEIIRPTALLLGKVEP